MNVSRVEAISPKQIDWRKLTAKDIIKYEEQGIEVPSQYLQWAKQFRQDIEANDNDETTYEMATSKTSTQTEPTMVTEGTDDEAEPTAAQAKREALNEQGVSLRKQTLIFTKDSKEASKAVLQSAAIITDTEEESNNEIQSLESYMQVLLSKAEATQNELKNEVAKINDSKNDKNSFGKINKLQKQLERYGKEGQANLAQSEGQFNNFNSIIDSQTGTIFNAQDFGTETIGVGNELIDVAKRYLFLGIIDYIIGKRAVRTGERAVNFSEMTEAIQTEALEKNSENKNNVYKFKDQVEDKTGVAGITLEDTDNKGEETGNPTDQNNNQTETDKIASGNLDQILQAKIKKGEELNA